MWQPTGKGTREKQNNDGKLQQLVNFVCEEQGGNMEELGKIAKFGRAFIKCRDAALKTVQSVIIEVYIIRHFYYLFVTSCIKILSRLAHF